MTSASLLRFDFRGRFLRLWHRIAYLRYDPTPAVAAVITILLTYLVLAPIGAMVVDTVRVQLRDSALLGLPIGTLTPSFFQRTFTSGISDILFWEPLQRTIFVATLVSVIAIPLGAVSAWVVVRTDMP